MMSKQEERESEISIVFNRRCIDIVGDVVVLKNQEKPPAKGVSVKYEISNNLYEQVYIGIFRDGLSVFYCNFFEDRHIKYSLSGGQSTVENVKK